MVPRPARLVAAALFVAVAMPAAARAENASTSAPPYLLVRSLQTIQDKVIAGDIESLDVQRYLLNEIDRRLRTIDFCRVVASPAELEAALDVRLKELALAWNTSSS